MTDVGETVKVNCNIVLSNDGGELPDDLRIEDIVSRALKNEFKSQLPDGMTLDCLAVEVIYRTGELD